jgi:hypothetical protein
MGGMGSGGRNQQRALYEGLRPIDLAVLRRQNPTPGKTYNITWSFGERATGITAWAVDKDGRGIRMRHLEFLPQGGTDDVSRLITFTTTRQNGEHPIAQLAGSARRWLSCPSCGRACRVVYAKAGFRCRRCIGNGTYKSQSESKRWRQVTQAQKLHKRYGGSGNITEPFPRKPRAMHWRKYRKLEARFLACQCQAAAGLAAAVANLKRRLER